MRSSRASPDFVNAFRTQDTRLLFARCQLTRLRGWFDHGEASSNVGREREIDKKLVVSAIRATWSIPFAPQHPSSENLDHSLEVIGKHMETHLCTDLFKILVRKCALPIHNLIVPKGCSTVWRRMRILSGVRSRRVCMDSRTSSRSQRVTRHCLLGVHFSLKAHCLQFELQ